MEDGRFSARSVTAAQPSRLAVRLLVVVAAVLGALALRASTPAGTGEGIGGHPATVSAAGPAVVTGVAVSSGGDFDGCHGPLECETRSAPGGIRLGVDEFRLPGVAAVLALPSGDESLPARGRVSIQRSPARPIGLALTTLAVSRI